jgi:hypothetical protein
MGEVLGKLFVAFTPLVLKLITDWQQANNTTRMPTLEELTTDYQDTIDSYLAEGAAWRQSHPNA